MGDSYPMPFSLPFSLSFSFATASPPLPGLDLPGSTSILSLWPTGHPPRKYTRIHVAPLSSAGGLRASFLTPSPWERERERERECRTFVSASRAYIEPEKRIASARPRIASVRSIRGRVDCPRSAILRRQLRQFGPMWMPAFSRLRAARREREGGRARLFSPPQRGSCALRARLEWPVIFTSCRSPVRLLYFRAVALPMMPWFVCSKVHC